MEPHDIPEALLATESVTQSNTSVENNIELDLEENLIYQYIIASNETSLISNLFDISDVR